MSTPKKRCTKCNNEKETTEFYKQKDGKYGVRGDCKVCVLKQQKLNVDRELQIKRSREYYKKHKNDINTKKRERRKTDEEFREKQNLAVRDWRKVNPTYSTEYHHERYHNDPQFRKRINLTNTMGRIMNGQNCVEGYSLLGCTFDELKQHLESQFQDGMTWDNYGKDGWQVDHIIPWSAFDLTNEHAQAVCFHWSNTQPLWGNDNNSKNNTIPDLGIEIDLEFVRNVNQMYEYL